MRMRTAVATTALGALLVFSGSDVLASSHREAPFITKNPKVDATDFYMFNSYEAGRGAFVTLIANYQPLQAAYGGPNYFTMDQEALYEIHIDNSGDGIEDLTFQFRFQNKLNDATGDIGIALPVTGDAGAKTNSIPLNTLNVLGGPDGGVAPITTANAATALNVLETYSVRLVTGPRRAGTPADVINSAGGPTPTVFKKPLDYMGKKMFAGAGATPAAGLLAYEAYAKAHIYDVTVPGCATAGSRVFVGQRHESFAVNLGVIFDAIDADLNVITNPANRGALPSPIDGTNVTTIALEIPTACLTKGAEMVLGGWTSASVRQARVVNPNPKWSSPVKEGGAWAQVSRLGMPLTNELVIGIKDKDKFNTSEPKDDAQWADYVTNPILPVYLTALFGSANVPPVPITRADLVTIFLTGVPGVNKFAGTSAVAEMLRLNTALGAQAAGPINTNAPGGQTNLGATLCFPNTPGPTGGGSFTLVPGNPGCDPAGFPNGRRPGDDVVDIELTSVLGYFLPRAQAGGSGIILHDAVLQDNSQFDTAFPYLKAPNPGS